MRILTRTAAALAGLAIAVTTGIGAAHADPDDYTTPFQPDGDDVVGVGSDTTQFALNGIADYWNENVTTGPRLASWDAFNPDTGLPGGTIWVSDEDNDGIQDPEETIARPNGSGAGVTELRRTVNCSTDPDDATSPVEFARSSSARTAAHSQCNGTFGGVQILFLPFAKDTTAYAVNASNLAVGDFPGDAAGTNAPLDLTTAELRDIYNCTDTLWSQVRTGLPAVAINPLIPQQNSGTRTTFISSIGLTDVGVCVDEVQEHDPHAVDGDPNAIAPFSVGRHATQVPADANDVKPIQLNTSGYEFSRPLFNVVIDQSPGDGTAIGGVDEKLHDLFGDNDLNYGWICSDEAAAVIAAEGFIQLGTIDDGEFEYPCGIAQ